MEGFFLDGQLKSTNLHWQVNIFQSLKVSSSFTFISFLSLFLLKGNEFYFGLFDLGKKIVQKNYGPL